MKRWIPLFVTAIATSVFVVAASGQPTRSTQAGGGVSGSGALYGYTIANVDMANGDAGVPPFVVSKTLTVAAGDVVTLDVFGNAANLSGTTRKWPLKCSVGTDSIEDASSQQLSNIALTSRQSFHYTCVFGIVSASSTHIRMETRKTAGSVATTGFLADTTNRVGWYEGTADNTGTQTFSVSAYSTSVGVNTQTMAITGIRIEHLKP